MLTVVVAIAVAEIVDRTLARRGRKVQEAFSLSPVADTRLRLVRRLIFATIIVLGLGLALAVLAVSTFRGAAVASPEEDGLSVSIESTSAVTRQAGTMQYRVMATNTGATTVSPVAIRIALSRETELSWSSSTSSIACTPSHTALSCRVPSLSSSESVYLTIVAVVDATATGKVGATATVAGGGVSSSASATNVVDLRYPKPADLALTVKTASGGPQGNLDLADRRPDRRLDDEWNLRGGEPGREPDYLRPSR